MEQAGWQCRTIREAPREWETNERAFMQADGRAQRALPEEVNDAKQADACLARGKPILAPERHGI